MSALISPEDLLDRLDDIVVVDVQYHLGAVGRGRDDFERAHLPGAHHVDLDAELAGPPGPGGRHPLPTAHSVQAALRRCGVDADTRVVVYDQGACTAAARAWWVFGYYGLGFVQVLDGGLAAWTGAGGPVSTQVPPPGAGTFEAHAGGMPLLDADGAAEVARLGVLLDARSTERWAGETEPIDPVAGHIPGAVSAPTVDNMGPDGRFLPQQELRARFTALGVRPGRPVGTYCGSGVTAAHQALALHEIGVETPVYVGSWSHWITDPARPVATGRTP
ncbi:sulfurtransferase [Knoellia sp. 3-2P3]|uniref:sulfurtransferase n=1 Tax=unclassified Knoellia TaxID=2618719 RepID=UPI0023DA0145|nr:sulfurtransferase [Knoellia sp. 3-2P3]MDF2092709.1 sulfurtransferase [Knoellia sp. 3-2P3]